MSTRTQDRRRDPRVTVWSPLTLIADGVEHRATLRNLSLAGVSCTAMEGFELGRSLRLRLELRQSEDDADRFRFEVQGQVVRSERTRRGAARRRLELGISFGELDAKTRETLDEFLRRRLGNSKG